MRDARTTQARIITRGQAHNGCFYSVATRNDNFTLLQTKRGQGRVHFLFWLLALFLCLLTLMPHLANAQVLFGSVVGTVTDATGGVVPDATVTITNLETNDTRTAQTNGSGLYTVSTVPAGMYKVVITKPGFKGFDNSNADVIANEVLRVDAALQVGTVSQTVEVHSQALALQTDTADVHAELSTQTLENAPQATRSYEGVLNLVPGVVPPGGQLAGGTNNPSKSMQFAANGSGTQGPNVRIEGVNATNPWVQQYTTFVPSVEAIQSVNVVTNSPDAEQGLSGGPSVTVLLKSGSNSIHGSAYELNINSWTEAKAYFQPLTQPKPPHLVDNDTGVTLGGPIIRDKLFYFGSYEGDFYIQALNGYVSVPTPAMLQGDESASPTPIYDPMTGVQSGPNAGQGRTAFPGNKIPADRLDPIIAKLTALVPPPNDPSAGIQNNLNLNQGSTYHLHKIDTKFDYIATHKLRISGRYGYQPYYNLQEPLFGPVLGGESASWPAFASAGSGQYIQHGATLAVSASATYVASPTWVIDGTFGITQAHQIMVPVQGGVKYGLDVLGIPGTNQNALPLGGGIPDFAINNFGGTQSLPTFGYAYPPLEYKDPVFEYVANVTKTKGSHNIRFGEDVIRVHVNHQEVRATLFNFTGGLTSLNAKGAPATNAYNSVADFILGLPQFETNWVQFDDWLSLRSWQISAYVRDQWQASPKLTINYGVRWEHYPVPTRTNRGIEYNNMLTDPSNATIEVCGVGGNPGNCGISVSNKLFAPNIGISYRPISNFVVRAGFSLSPIQTAMGQPIVQNYPAEQQYTATGSNSFSAAGTIEQGYPVLVAPTIPSNGNVPIPVGTANANTTQKNFVRGYVESWNLNLERELGAGFVANVGYVGTHVVNLDGSYNFNHGTLGGGAASQPLNTPTEKITGSTSVYEPILWDIYNSLQATLNKRFSHGLSLRMAYTYSKDMEGGFPSTGILEPAYEARNTSITPVDRTHNYIVNSTYEAPFGKDKPFLNHGVGAAILGGWSLNGTFAHLSGIPFSVTASGTSCNCPGNTQRANQIKPNVARTGRGIGNGATYFDTTAFTNVTNVAYGTASLYSIRGPGYTDLDAAIGRQFHIWERVNLNIRLDSYNATNRPHFANPGASVSSEILNPNGSVKSNNGFGQITGTTPLGRTIDQRYFRLGGRITW
jgi:Carboxypeptidase regulatory-like domain/TonB dependent receptor